LFPKTLHSCSQIYCTSFSRNHCISFSCLQFEKQLKERRDQGENWWNLRACSYYDLFDKEKIIYPETTVRRSEFYFDNNGYFIDKTCFMITGENLKFLTGILSSKALEWYLESELRLLGKNSIQYSKQFIEQIPIPAITKKNQPIKTEIENHVDKIQALKKNLNEIKLQTKRNQILSKIQFHESKIDDLVFDLYGLDQNETIIVKGGK